jgi:hypothetical protein
MTKKAMVDYIEKTNLVVNFNRNNLMRKSKDSLVSLYELCKKNYEKSLTKAE